MTCQYSVTFEFETRQPVTQKGSITAGSVAVCAQKSIKAAKRELQPRQWSSVVCVLENRGVDE